jgi:hypothetical protein
LGVGSFTLKFSILQIILRGIIQNAKVDFIEIRDLSENKTFQVSTLTFVYSSVLHEWGLHEMSKI